MDPVRGVLAWARTKDIGIHGICPKHLPGRGIGIIATRPLQAREVVLRVRTDKLRALGNTPPHIVAALKGASVHAILSAALCLERDADFEPWRAVLPSRSDTTASMPLCWPVELQQLLPPGAKAFLHKQELKYNKDLANVHSAFPEIKRSDFLYAWCLVNSRTFYHTTPKTESLPKEDHMVLQPVADLFNHSPHNYCSVTYDAHEFTFTTTAACNAGDELFIQYGSHSNDFLLVEYGFVLPEGNTHDEICLDEYMCDLFSKRQRQELEDAGFWKKYMLDTETACYRTQTALRLLCIPLSQWKDVLDGIRDEDTDADDVNEQLSLVLARCERDIERNLTQLERLTGGEESARTCLHMRWLQIRQLVDDAMPGKKWDADK